MAISCRRWSNTLWSLKPGHRNRIQSMQVPKYFSLGSSSSKDNDLWPCQHGRMSVPWCWRCSWDFWFREFVGIDIENVSIVEVSVTFSFACEIVPAKNYDRGSWQSCAVSASGARTNTLDDGVSPLPPSDLQFPVWIFAGLLWVRTLTFWCALLTVGLAGLLAGLWVLRLLHLLHVWAFFLLLLFIRSALLVAFVFLWVLWRIVALHL